MTLSVTHSFVDQIADDPKDAASGHVLPSHWNAEHTLSGIADISQGGTGASTVLGAIASLGVRTPLSTSASYFVSTTGSDSTGDGSSGNPWATIQHAYDWVCQNIDTKNNDFTINMAAGTYTGNLLIFKPWTGGGNFHLVGVGATSTIFNITGSHAVAGFVAVPGEILVSGFQVNTTGSNNGIASFCAGCVITVNGNISFGACGLAQLYAQFGGVITLTSSHQIDGDAQYHFVVDRLSNINVNGTITCTINGARTYTGQFAHANGLCVLGPMGGVTYTLAGGASVTGTRFQAQDNAIIVTGTGDLHFFPGSIEGGTQSGSLYDDVMYGTVSVDLTNQTNQTAIKVSNYSLTGSDTHALANLSGTWNTSGNVSAILLRITNTASGASSKLIDLGTSASQFSVDASGNTIFNGSLGVAGGAATAAITMGPTSGAAGVAKQIFFPQATTSGTVGPNIVINANGTNGYFGLGVGNLSGQRFWFGQTSNAAQGWDTSTTASHQAHFEVFNGVLGLGQGGTVDAYIGRSASGVIAFSTGITIDGSATILAKTKAGAPTTSDVPSGAWALIRDTSGATTKLYYNNAGALQSVALA